ncbi:hypothetical protein [Candidatus Nitrotoga sp. M5]|uniref:hypothetical protein n=1 Tax=Candidatus Nitrotoga sp. M5 TaxID=2890409 RepID=UPI001EF38369|nr:hypothetical protein [Candidatus Nitrotoga sp. M5]CAH1386335.1 hypothetical protein NTGM5_260052 [Candidatus Nitrotoga sp. M5]
MSIIFQYRALLVARVVWAIIFTVILSSAVRADDTGEFEDEYWVLPNFMVGDNTTLTTEQSDQFELITAQILRRLEEKEFKVKRCVRIVGHASTWKDTPEDKYCPRSVARGKAAAEHLQKFLSAPEGYFSGKKIRSKIVSEDTVGLGETGICDGAAQTAVCNPLDGTDVTIVYGGRANHEPLFNNMPTSISKEAQANRANNRRVEITLPVVPISWCERHKPLGKRLSRITLKGESREQIRKLEGIRRTLRSHYLCDEDSLERVKLFNFNDEEFNEFEGKPIIRFFSQDLYEAFENHEIAVALDDKGKVIPLGNTDPKIAKMVIRKCKNIRGKRLESCLKWIKSRIDGHLQILENEISDFNLESSGTPWLRRKTLECKIARRILKQEHKGMRTPYAGYKAELKKLRGWCFKADD